MSRLVFALFSLAMLAAAPCARAASASAAGQEPVQFEADRLIHDDKAQTLTALGNVELRQAGRLLRAERLDYDIAKDSVTASGHVIFRDVSGDTHFAERMTLSNRMKDGAVQGLQSYLANGGKFTAREGERRNATVTTMRDASYTTCECDTSRTGPPAWRLRAGKIVYNEDEHRVVYNNAKFDVFGVPVLWTPYFSHPDGKIKRKSGFLPPSFGYDSQMGASMTNRYYLDIAPDKDATFGVTAMTGENPLGLAEYRQRFDSAELKLSGSATSSSRKDEVDGQSVERGEEFRGHLFADGRWDMSDTWRSGLKLRTVTDDQYLRQYDLSGEDVLENELYAERFSGRDYAVVRAMAFQDVRVDTDQTDQPSVLPEAIATFTGEPNAALGGRWTAGLSALGVTRFGSGQDVNRVSANAGWQRRVLTGFGMVTTLDASVRGDAYQVRDRDDSGGNADRTGYAARVFPTAHATVSYPFVRRMDKAQVIVEPLASVTARPNLNVDNSDIPNEDSQDVQLDASNLFDADRFPGYDRVEDKTHAAYGVRTGVYGDGGSYGSVFLGQSYRLSDGDNPFPKGSGLSTQSSDYVGEIDGVYGDRFSLNYRFQLSSDSFASQRHEVDANAKWDRLSLTSRYLYAKALEGTDIEENRQQLENMAKLQLTKSWFARTGAVYDLGNGASLRKAILGADYDGCCLFLSLTAVRNLTTDTSGDSGTDVTFRIGLKGLGGETE